MKTNYSLVTGVTGADENFRLYLWLLLYWYFESWITLWTCVKMHVRKQIHLMHYYSIYIRTFPSVRSCKLQHLLDKHINVFIYVMSIIIRLRSEYIDVAVNSHVICQVKVLLFLFSICLFLLYYWHKYSLTLQYCHFLLFLYIGVCSMLLSVMISPASLV